MIPIAPNSVAILLSTIILIYLLTPVSFTKVNFLFCDTHHLTLYFLIILLSNYLLILTVIISFHLIFMLFW